MLRAKNKQEDDGDVKPSEKLDLLQCLARECADNPNGMYLIELLAEHADEEETTREFLRWVSSWIP